MTWPDWTHWYATAFSLRTDQDAEMLTAWVGLFTSRGWEPDEVNAACRTRFDALAACKYRTQHLEIISTAVNDARVREDARRQAEVGGDPRGVCCDCGGSGMMGGMPHPKPTPTSPWATCAVLCHCALGNWLGQRQAGDGRMISYREYTSRVPDWRERQAAYHRWLAAKNAAENVTGHLDKLLGSILAKAKARTAPPVAAPADDEPGF